MPKRDSAEAKVVQYFSTAPYGIAETVFGICKGVMKSRAGDQLPSGTAGSTQPKPRKTRTKKIKGTGATAGAGTSTSFPGSDVGTAA
jgi:hypothetical protein